MTGPHRDPVLVCHCLRRSARSRPGSLLAGVRHGVEGSAADGVRAGQGVGQPLLVVALDAIPDLTLAWTLAPSALAALAPISLNGTIGFGTGPALPVGIEAHCAPEPGRVRKDNLVKVQRDRGIRRKR
jgi:hypothetical protein